MITSFYNAMHDETGDLVEHKTRVLNPLYNLRESLTQEQLERTSRAWQFITESGAGEYMDASGVQRYLERKGVRITDDDDLAQASLSLDYMTAEINALSFIRCEFQHDQILVQFTNLSIRSFTPMYLCWCWSGV